MKTRAQFWEKTLFATGRKLNFKKCYWYLVKWVWDDDGFPSIATSADIPANMSLTYSSSSESSIIQRKEPTEALKTLGCWSSPSGQQDTQLQETTATLQDITKNIKATPMSQLEGRLLIPVYLHSKLRYIFSATSRVYSSLFSPWAPTIKRPCRETYTPLP
mmetsp:Transcript_4931/g.7602  ORF Transcript_4931/g.7602 Transcript_4931/m.7602 type:complete len:161 (-) Transcript_4931:1358-1840(-)